MSTAVEEKPATEEAAKTTRKAKAAPTADMFDLSSIGVVVEKPRKATDKFSAVLYAPPKFGKTTLLGSCADVPELSPVLICATEDGTSVLAANYAEDPNLDVINLADWPTAAKLITAVANGQTKYKTIGVDTISELQELMKAYRTNDGTKGMEWDDYGYIAEETVKVVKMLHRSPHVNVIFTTHTEKVKDDSTGKLMTSPYFLGKKSLGEVLKPIDLILYLAITEVDGEPTRVMLTKPDGKHDAGDRTGKLAKFIPNPTFAEVFAQLTAE